MNGDSVALCTIQSWTLGLPSSFLIQALVRDLCSVVAAVQRLTAPKEAGRGRRWHPFIKVERERQSVENASLSAEEAEPRHGRKPTSRLCEQWTGTPAPTPSVTVLPPAFDGGLHHTSDAVGCVMRPLGLSANGTQPRGQACDFLQTRRLRAAMPQGMARASVKPNEEFKAIAFSPSPNVSLYKATTSRLSRVQRSQIQGPCGDEAEPAGAYPRTCDARR
jgi:hypothetical protein